MNFVDIRNKLSAAVCIYVPRKLNDFKLRKHGDKLYIYFLVECGQTDLFACEIDHSKHSDRLPEIQKIFQDNFESVETSLTEKLLMERMRSLNEGITFYDIDEATNNIVFKYNSVYYSCYLTNMTEHNTPVRLNMNNGLGVKRCPSNYAFLAFVKDRNVHVTEIITNNTIQCTNSGENIGSGQTHFVIEEEFDRYDGLWWRPKEYKQNEMHLLIEEFDESNVKEVVIANYIGDTGAERYRYPRPGKSNAVSTLKLLRIRSEGSGFHLDACLQLPRGLMELFPGYEYLTNAGWTPDGKYVWIQLITRLQNKFTTFLIPIEAFTADQQKPSPNSNYAVRFCEEINNDYWVYVNFNTRFMETRVPGINQSKSLSQTAIMGYGVNQFHHLVLVSQSWEAPMTTGTDAWQIIEPTHDLFVNVTSGNWVVDKEKIWVDEKSKEVYFLANRDNDISQYLYKASYGATPTSESSIVQLTNSYTDAYINFNHRKAILTESSLHKSPIVTLTDLQPINQQTRTILYKHDPVESIRYLNLNPNSAPILLKYPVPNDDSVYMYGLLYLPQTSSGTSKKWPTLHYVYGGPGVRIIEDKFPNRLHMLAQKLNHFGFALLICDCRGSTGRGYKFEGNLKLKMGQVELNDQIYFLKKAAQETNLIDLDRVGIHGSSYGGYMTILAMLMHNDVYKCGFSCSPVTDWQLYDTAYTERYMGLPDCSKEAYDAGSALSHLSKLPDDKGNILLIAHGGIDENVHFQHTAKFLERANKEGKNIRLLFYPSSRHGISDRIHLETNLILYLHDKMIRNTPANTAN